MCGFVGFWEPRSDRTETSRLRDLERMRDSITHRGPDDSGQWMCTETGIALGFRRLSILDLSPAGHQPMQSDDLAHSIVFNGEIYNHKQLRTQLDRECEIAWKSASDTETLLRSLIQWGIEETLAKAKGMFSFAYWDHNNRTLTMARDRMGEKPLYYAIMGTSLIFGSELKALRLHGHFEGRISQSAINEFLRSSCVPAPLCIYRDTFKLPAGCYIQFDQAVDWKQASPKAYWSIGEAMRNGRANPLSESPESVTQQIIDSLRASIDLQMVADVPLGAFLSGGIDSSLVVALMQEHSERKIDTFSIGFKEAAYDESPFAKAVSDKIGTRHHELIVDKKDIFQTIEKIPEVWDEPFADPSQIPTLLLAEMTRKEVTVSLSGDGGDELFLGYDRYQRVASAYTRLQKIPLDIRRPLAKILWQLAKLSLPTPPLDRLDRKLIPQRLSKLAHILGSSNIIELKTAMEDFWHLAQSPLLDTWLADHDDSSGSDYSRQAAYDTRFYLGDCILTKLDRASMAHSLEGRCPFLDRDFIELAMRVPQSLKIKDGTGKWLLREALRSRIGDKLVDRPKTGFSPPLNEWLRSDLRPLLTSTVNSQALSAHGLVDTKQAMQTINAHLTGAASRAASSWNLLILQMWLNRWA